MDIHTSFPVPSLCEQFSYHVVATFTLCWSYHDLLRSQPTANKIKVQTFHSSNNLFSTYSFNCFHTVWISNPREWLLPAYFLPLSLSVLLFFHQLLPIHFRTSRPSASRIGSSPFLPGLPGISFSRHIDLKIWLYWLLFTNKSFYNLKSTWTVPRKIHINIMKHIIAGIPWQHGPWTPEEDSLVRVQQSPILILTENLPVLGAVLVLKTQKWHHDHLL